MLNCLSSKRKLCCTSCLARMCSCLFQPGLGSPCMCYLRVLTFFMAVVSVLACDHSRLAIMLPYMYIVLMLYELARLFGQIFLHYVWISLHALTINWLYSWSLHHREARNLLVDDQTLFTMGGEKGLGMRLNEAVLPVLLRMLSMCHASTPSR